MSHEVKGFWLDLYTPAMIDLDPASPMYQTYKAFWNIVAEDLVQTERQRRIAKAIANDITEVSFNGLRAADAETDIEQEEYDTFLGNIAGVIQNQAKLSDEEYQEAVLDGLKSLEMKEWYGYQA